MDIHYIRANPDLCRENQKNRFADPNIVDNILDIDSVLKIYIHKIDQIRCVKNKIDKSFNKTSNNDADATVVWDEDFYTIDNLIEDLISGTKDVDNLIKKQLLIIVTHIKEILDKYIEIQKELQLKRDNLIHSLGNRLNPFVTISDNEDNNTIICTKEGFKPEIDNPLTHIDLLDKLKFVNTSDGIKVAGNRGYFLTGMGVRLNNALISYALDFLMSKGYTLMETPHFVTGDLMGIVSQLSDYTDTLYKLKDEDKYLIATSEQPMTAYFNNKMVNRKDLPIKFGGVSTCYRKEVGAHGIQTKGIFRVHQFTKVEQFCVTTPDQSWSMFEEMIGLTKEFYDSLNISYRVVNIVSGALNNSASMKYDLEAYFPGTKEYKELVSCTNCLDYFSKRLMTRYTKTDYVHMLNCTLCANTRTLCCLVETYQTEDGIIVPDVLRPYLGNINTIKFT